MGMAEFKVKRDHRTLILRVQTDERVTSYGGTSFVPNHCEAMIDLGRIITLNLSQLDENGWGVDDPAGPEGAELHASFYPGYSGLPEIAREAFKTIAWCIR